MSSTLKPCSLQQALDYTNDDIIHRFLSLYDVTFEEAADVFEETKKWLWLVAQPDSPGMAIVDGMFILDEMWHNFVLFTYDYARYCQDNYGRYLHHAPKPHLDKEEYKEKLARDPETVRAQELETMLRRCAFIHDKLGTETLIKWFVEYPQKYNETFFRERRKTVELNYTPPEELCTLAEHIRTGRVLVA